MHKEFPKGFSQPPLGRGAKINTRKSFAKMISRARAEPEQAALRSGCIGKTPNFEGLVVCWERPQGATLAGELKASLCLPRRSSLPPLLLPPPQLALRQGVSPDILARWRFAAGYYKAAEAGRADAAARRRMEWVCLLTCLNLTLGEASE